MLQATTILAALTLVVAACGSSSSSASKTGAAASFAARRATIAACLKKQGITLPQRPPGAGRPPAGNVGAGGALGGLFEVGPRPGARGPQFQAAMRKCGLRARGGRGRLFLTAAGKSALKAFVACVRGSGYPLPAPNTSGTGPVFDPKKVNRTNPKLIVAAAKCQHLLPQPRFGGGAPAGPPGGPGQ